MNFAVLASGQGGNLQAIIDAVKRKKIKAHLCLVISDKKDAYALVRARKAGIEAIDLNPKDFKNRAEFDAEVLLYLKKFKIDFVVLAGYMRLLSSEFIRQYSNKIINIHPALLPAFKGTQGIKDAFDYGVKVTGVTVHFVVDEMDAGAIIMQEAIKVTSKDTPETLARKIHAIEHKIYPKAIDLLLQGKLKISGRTVKVV